MDKEELIKFWSYPPPDPNPGIYCRILEHCETRHFFHNLAISLGEWLDVRENFNTHTHMCPWTKIIFKSPLNFGSSPDPESGLWNPDQILLGGNMRSLTALVTTEWSFSRVSVRRLAVSPSLDVSVSLLHYDETVMKLSGEFRSWHHRLGVAVSKIYSFNTHAVIPTTVQSTTASLSAYRGVQSFSITFLFFNTDLQLNGHLDNVTI